MTFYERALAEKERLLREIAVLVKKIEEAPEGSLIYHKNGSRFKYYQQISHGADLKKRETRYLRKKEFDLVEKLAQKAVWRRQFQDLRQQLAEVDLYLNAHAAHPATTFDHLCHSELLQKVLFTEAPEPDQFITNWLRQPFESNPSHPETLKVPTTRGRFVRSKSEAFIAYSLDKHHVPYKYESRLPISFPVIYPDFTILHPETHQLLIWEHFGLIDDPDYLQSAANKMRIYIQHGYIPNRNLFMTFESSDYPLDINSVDWLIENLIL